MPFNHSFFRTCSLCALVLASTAAIASGPRLDRVQMRRTVIEAPNGTQTEATGVNNAGVVIGVYNSPLARAFAWSRRGGFVDLEGVVESEFSLPHAINNCGQVVGELDGHAALWNTFDEVEDLGTLGGGSSVAAAINDRGDVVGSSQVIPGGRSTPFLWTESEGMREIFDCDGPSGIGTGINNAREVVGSCTHSTGTHAFFWSEATGRIDFPGAGFTSTSAIAINDRGEVAGQATTQDPTFRVVTFKWTPRAHRVVYLRELGEFFDVVSDINRFGWVTGSAVGAAEFRQATVWLKPRLGFLVDPALGLYSTTSELNDLGSIAGTIDVGTRDFRAVLWDPPPIVARVLRKQGIGRCLRP